MQATGDKPEHGQSPAWRSSGVENELARFLNGGVGKRICLFGIGHRQWRDDGVGSLIAEALQGRAQFDVVDAGSVPENYLETVAGKKPDTILMIDATDFGGTPGELRLMETKNVVQSGLSTHAGSLRMLAKYLQVRTGASIGLLAIQPADCSFGRGLSPAMSQTAQYLQQALPALVGASVR
jgi:hydrogenase 3 maturation protease